MVATEVGQLRQLGVGVCELSRYEHRLAHVQEDRGEVRPVAVRPRQIPAVRAAERLLMAEGDLEVLPYADPSSGVVKRQALREERQVARPQAILGGGHQQPEVEVV